MTVVDILNVIRDGIFSNGNSDNVLKNTDVEYLRSIFEGFDIFSDEVISDKSELICVTLDKDDLVALVSGMSPSYSIMNFLQFYKLGYYTGGHCDEWTWSNVVLSKLNAMQLYRIYMILKSDQLNRTNS